MNDRRKDDEHYIFVKEELKRQGEVQTRMLCSIQDIEKHLAVQEIKLRTITGVIAFAISGVTSLVSGAIMYFIKRG